MSFYHKGGSRRTWKAVYLFKKNTKRQITFSFPIEKEVTRIDKNGKEMTYHILQITIYW